MASSFWLLLDQGISWDWTDLFAEKILNNPSKVKNVASEDLGLYHT
jgi:hypothetical protein